MTEVIAGKRIAYTWRYEGYEGDSLVTWELFEDRGKTRLRLTHSGLHTFPANVPDLAKSNFEMGWNQIVGESLRLWLASE